MEWIKCSDRLPDKSGYYLVITIGNNANVLEFSKRHSAFNAGDSRDDNEFEIKCVWWTEIPELPTEGGEKE